MVFLFLHENNNIHVRCWYSLEASRCGTSNVYRVNNICFHGEMRTNIKPFWLQKVPYFSYIIKFVHL